MQCQNCHQPLEATAAFCGNCGHPVAPNSAQQQDEPYHSHAYTPPAAAGAHDFVSQTPPTSLPAPLPIPASTQAVPAYAIAAPNSHAGETKALLSILFGVFGLLGAIIPLIGLVFAMAGLVMGTMSRSSHRKTWSTVGLILSSLAIIASLAVWAFVAKEALDDQKKTKVTTADAVVSADLDTACYVANFVDRLNITNKEDSCDATAYNGPSFGESTDAYKIFANKAVVNDPAQFTTLAKEALEKDIKTNLEGFTIDSQRVSSFAGSPAYTITASSEEQGLSVVETAVYHPVENGENIFIIVHGVNGEDADLKILEAKWQWK